jgi:hypothetical protein
MITIKNKEKIKGTKFLVHSNEFTIIEMDDADNYTYKITVKYYERVTYQTGNITTPGLREVFKVLKLNRKKCNRPNSGGNSIYKHNHYILSDEMNKSVLINLCEIKSFRKFVCAIQKFIVDNF